VTLDVLEGVLSPGLRARTHWQAVLADVDEQTWRRRRKLRAFRGRADWEGHVETTRARFRAALGPLPLSQGAPPAVERTGVLERDGYAVEKLLLETQPGFWAAANLYLPARPAGRAPAILNAVGHWEHSKAQEVEQARCIGQARKGYVALIWDPLGQGERFQYWDEARRAPWPGSSTEQHAAVCNPALLLGSTVIATMLWDGVRMLDYLAARPEVDPERIGCTGVSGGGTYTMFLGAFDRRLKATVPVCSTSTLERKHRQGQIGEPCQDPWRAYPDDLDTADLLLAQAPAALRLIGTRWDTFPLAGLREVALEVQDGYAALGIPEKTDLCVVDAHHDYNREQRERMYAWMNRWLEHDAPVEEAPYAAEDPPRLWCTRTGQLLTDGLGRTAPDLVRDLAAGVIPAPAPLDTAAAAGRERDRVLGAARRLLGDAPPLDGAPPVERPPARCGGLVVERLILQARMDVPLPTLVFRPPPGGDRAEGAGWPPTPHERGPALIVVDDRGKGAEGGEEGLTPALARAGILALAVDLRGWGETAWVNQRFGWSQDRRALLGADNLLAYVGYMLGAPSVAQRVQDVLGVLRYVRGRPDVDPRRVWLCGRGGGAVVALHAAALDGAVRGVALDAGMATYRSAVEAPRNLQPVADFLPGVLLHYDLPDLAAALAPAGVLVLNPVGADGQPLPPATAAGAYAGAARAAGRLGGRLEVAAGCPAGARAARIATWIAEARAGGPAGPTGRADG
jgi:dienelactone hydrolase